MKVLVVEDEYYLVVKAFEYLNLVYMGGRLTVENVQRSQDIRPLDRIKEFDAVFVDVSLAADTEMDGYALLRRCLDLRSGPSQRFALLTGSDGVHERLDELGLSGKGITVLKKPISFIEIKDVLGIAGEEQ